MEGLGPLPAAARGGRGRRAAARIGLTGFDALPGAPGRPWRNRDTSIFDDGGRGVSSIGPGSVVENRRVSVRSGGCRSGNKKAVLPGAAGRRAAERRLIFRQGGGYPAGQGGGSCGLLRRCPRLAGEPGGQGCGGHPQGGGQLPLLIKAALAALINTARAAAGAGRRSGPRWRPGPPPWCHKSSGPRLGPAAAPVGACGGMGRGRIGPDGCSVRVYGFFYGVSHLIAGGHVCFFSGLQVVVACIPGSPSPD